jgi:hypothetical protein
MVQRADIARLLIGITLGLVLGVVLHQSGARQNDLYRGLLSQGAFGADTSGCGASAYSHGGCGMDCVPVSGCDGGYATLQECNDVYQAQCASSLSVCIGDTDGDGDCDDDPAHVCCDGVCQLPDMCPSSSSYSSSVQEQWCCNHVLPPGPANCFQLP